MVKKKKTPVIVIDVDSGNKDDGYDTDGTDTGMPKMVKREYDSSDDKEDDASPQEDDKEEIEIMANSGKIPPVSTVSPSGRGLRDKKKPT